MDFRSRSNSATALLRLQHPDGGWGYGGGSSWTEPTAYALLALSGSVEAAEGIRRGRSWLLGLQRADGGWPPQAVVDQSTWVTALVVLGETLRPTTPELGKAVAWLAKQSGFESSWLHRVREILLSARRDYEEVHPGWPWFPATAAWVVPTSLTILALQKFAVRSPDSRIRQRIEEGRRFLLSRMCQDGGWNHGSSRALGFQANSYSETTGLALLALRGVADPKLNNSLRTAERHLLRCRSLEGISWLQLGLLAHGRRPASPAGVPGRTLIDFALGELAQRALAGENLFLTGGDGYVEAS